MGGDHEQQVEQHGCRWMPFDRCITCPNALSAAELAGQGRKRRRSSAFCCQRRYWCGLFRRHWTNDRTRDSHGKTGLGRKSGFRVRTCLMHRAGRLRERRLSCKAMMLVDAQRLHPWRG